MLLSGPAAHTDQRLCKN